MTEPGNERDDLKKDLNAIWRSTLKQFDGLKDAIVESSAAGKAKLDATWLKRERDQKLVEIGEAMLALVEEGKLVLPSGLTEAAARVRELEREIESQEQEFRRVFGRDAARGSETPEKTPTARADGADGGHEPPSTK